ncbi:MAG: Fis family transcriptional regulator [Sulfuricurvum sp. GWF2_44_89]|uniref:Fis family transcriptional regulator n=1 Tax=Sulfuricurvum kujiense TaxID=148813 RepID=A0A2D3WIC9_9BACT|nr:MULTISPECIES: YifB family Mg chelatase-like AAA ATPase [Sulfuricurvum]OHD77027.1 MAG: Fis family transcriptional regulator [Sulfuricurvum sp. GWF2_44_89]OHD95446.1 MAG: Fis family transcriptional regulator [Sulfuricurvum sp. RIFOXYD12_FULL_44_77]OHD99407.1 MAG: Fis family transcriptional regulator [Sulfuricurvum sp. RIFOXYD2_FULL_44_160]DAB37474.1 MAG TPA: Fis family transcriptional regulator [Sulfuricurvum kujiense]
MKQLLCATFEGIDASPVEVQFTATKGLPAFTIVGMANTAITESKERVKSALLSNGFTFPPKRLTINLAPSDLRKEGSHFDLPIATLIALGNYEGDLSSWYVFGELGLDGSVTENTLLYPIILSLAKQGIIERAIVPRISLPKLSKIPNIIFYGVETLTETLNLLRAEVLPETEAHISSFDYSHLIHEDTNYYFHEHYPLDFIDIKGQEHAKRSALIAAAGMHNLLLEGSPGSGKSMIAKRLVHIMPPLHNQEMLECAKLEILEGKEPTFSPLRPFRSPHHSSTGASIFGGGSHKAQIGEVGLAHGGILFFDELPHFSKTVLEALREPLEDRHIRISRVNTKVTYDANFLFVAAMNPCPCGNLFSTTTACRCSDLEINRYKSRLSDPFLDRIDLYVQMHAVSAEDKPSVSSHHLHAKVRHAFLRQKERGQERLNGSLNDAEIARYCPLNDETQQVIDQAIGRFGLSFRAVSRVLKVARTIADIEGESDIGKTHLLEALSYRKR